MFRWHLLGDLVLFTLVLQDWDTRDTSRLLDVVLVNYEQFYVWGSLVVYRWLRIREPNNSLGCKILSEKDFLPTICWRDSVLLTSESSDFWEPGEQTQDYSTHKSLTVTREKSLLEPRTLVYFLWHSMKVKVTDRVFLKNYLPLITLLIYLLLLSGVSSCPLFFLPHYLFTSGYHFII